MWLDLRELETQVGQRYLTHESDDERWEAYQRAQLGGNDPSMNPGGNSPDSNSTHLQLSPVRHMDRVSTL